VRDGGAVRRLGRRRASTTTGDTLLCPGRVAGPQCGWRRRWAVATRSRARARQVERGLERPVAPARLARGAVRAGRSPSPSVPAPSAALPSHGTPGASGSGSRRRLRVDGPRCGSDLEFPAPHASGRRPHRLHCVLKCAAGACRRVLGHAPLVPGASVAACGRRSAPARERSGPLLGQAPNPPPPCAPHSVRAQEMCDRRPPRPARRTRTGSVRRARGRPSPIARRPRSRRRIVTVMMSVR
jgi:hypothetical protein